MENNSVQAIIFGDEVCGHDLRSGEWRSCVESSHSSLAYDDLTVTVRAGGAEGRSMSHHAGWGVAGEDCGQRPVPDQFAAAGMVIGGLPGRWVDAGDLRGGDVLVSRRVPQTVVLERQCLVDVLRPNRSLGMSSPIPHGGLTPARGRY